MNRSLTCIFVVFAFISHAQSSRLVEDKLIEIRAFSEELQVPSHIVIPENSPLKTYESRKLIGEIFEFPASELHIKKDVILEKGIKIEKYNRYINSIRVAHGTYSVLSKDENIISIHAEHYKKSTLKNGDFLTESQALSKVLSNLQSEMFAWESTQQIINQLQVGDPKRKKLEHVLLNEYPVGEKVYVKDYNSDEANLELAYLFTIESVVPEFRDRIYVSATDGRILLRDPQVKHGVGDTRYSGSRSFPTTEIMGPPGALYELKGIESISGVFCETRSMEGLGGLPISSPAIVALSDSIVDGDEPDPCLTDGSDTVVEFGDDEWDSNEHRKVPFSTTGGSCCPAYAAGTCDEVKNDDIALDAHWGAAMVARYWMEMHNRFGYDDAGADIKSYVHHGSSYENASWNVMIKKYGYGAYQDGNNPAAMFSALVSLDVCAHEIGHAICTSTSDLVYVGESGAMNEGLSDIWAAAIEQYAIDSIDGTLDYLIWGIGEQIDERDGGLYDEPGARALRWMDHPPAENNPDTYGAGTWWQDPDCASPSAANDFCGVHFNSGVLNKWFYLLTTGSGQALSPGLNKPAFDDEINDKGHAYSVNGIGIRKTEKIIYGANLLLQPNSKFADMRAASIDIARSLYGPCSNEVEQTIKAWYAVGVGSNFGTCLPTIEFNQFNPFLISESSVENGCTASKEVILSLFSYMTTATVNFTTSGNAIEGEDYELCVNAIDFNGDEEKELKIAIFDDKIIEGNDTIIVHFNGGGFSGSDTIVIKDDDGIPVIGGVDTIFHETFDINDNSWQQELVNPTSLLNEWFVDAFNTNQAHISYPPSMNIPTYTQIVESHVRLKSPLINGLGRKNIEVSFSYQVGGERDAVDPNAIFDFGTFEVSSNGFDWEEIDVFVGNETGGGIVPDSGLYQIMLNQLDNSTFYLGYTWHNDALNGSPYSFMFDNVVVEGEGLSIESEVGDSMETNVPLNNNIAFVSDSDTEVIAFVDNASSDLGCTMVSVYDNDAVTDTIATICNLRSTKVFGFNSELYSDSIEITLFFDESEVDDWVDFSSLNVITYTNENIDSESSVFSIIDNSEITVNDQTNNGNGYVSYKCWISSDVKFLALTNRSSMLETHFVSNISDNDLLSFRNIVDLSCPNDTIRFIPDINGQTIQLTSGSVDLNKNLIIIGNGPTNTLIRNDINTTLHVWPFISISLQEIRIESSTPVSILNEGEIIIKEDVEILK